MATISYSSFPDPPHFDDENSSTTSPTHNQLSLMDAPVPVDLNILNISEIAIAEDDCVNAMNHLDSVGFHLSPSTPTKERVRRATMPDSMKPNFQEVLVPHSPFVLFLISLQLLMVVSISWPLFASSNSWHKNRESQSS